jgi:hypothetical protein
MRTRASSGRVLAHAAALCIALLSCTGEPRPSAGHRAAASAPPGPRREAGAGHPGAPAAAPAGPQPPAGPPPAEATELQGNFRSTTNLETLRLWTGPNDAKGWERLTKLVATIDGEGVYSMAGSVIRPAGVCRSTVRGLDQVLLSFNRRPQGPGGSGILWYDAARGRFTVNFLQEDITEDPEEHFDCSGGRSLLPGATPPRPCLCPWRDSPAGG